MNERKPPEAPPPASAEKKGRKRKGELEYEQIPEFGMAYGPNARAFILVLRGNGVVQYQNFTVRDHIHPDYVTVQREGSEPHASNQCFCNCQASQFGKVCSHRTVVAYCGGIVALKRAFAVFREQYSDKEGEHHSVPDTLQHP